MKARPDILSWEYLLKDKLEFKPIQDQTINQLIETLEITKKKRPDNKREMLYVYQKNIGGFNAEKEVGLFFT